MDRVSSQHQNLTDLLLPLGKLHDAETAARLAIKYAQRTENKWRQMVSYNSLAAVLHRQGQLQQAQQVFAKAEQLQQLRESSKPYLYSVAGAHYCAFLLDTANNTTDLNQILVRGEDSLKIVNNLLSIALDHLTLARTYQALQQAQIASKEFNSAIEGIQKAGKANHTSIFYLARADFYLTQNQLDPALADLNSAWEIIERCGMKLYAVDYLLIHGRYCLAIRDNETALNHYEEAKGLIQETGYHLRDAELDLFAAQLCQHQGSVAGKTADFYLQKAKKRIEEIGQWGLLRVIKRDFPEYGSSKGLGTRKVGIVSTLQRCEAGN